MDMTPYSSELVGLSDTESFINTEFIDKNWVSETLMMRTWTYQDVDGDVVSEFPVGLYLSIKSILFKPQIKENLDFIKILDKSWSPKNNFKYSLQFQRCVFELKRKLFAFDNWKVIEV